MSTNLSKEFLLYYTMALQVLDSSLLFSLFKFNPLNAQNSFLIFRALFDMCEGDVLQHHCGARTRLRCLSRVPRV